MVHHPVRMTSEGVIKRESCDDDRWPRRGEFRQMPSACKCFWALWGLPMLRAICDASILEVKHGNDADGGLGGVLEMCLRGLSLRALTFHLIRFAHNKR